MTLPNPDNLERFVEESRNLPTRGERYHYRQITSLNCHGITNDKLIRFQCVNDVSDFYYQLSGEQFYEYIPFLEENFITRQIRVSLSKHQIKYSHSRTRLKLSLGLRRS